MGYVRRNREDDSGEFTRQPFEFNGQWWIPSDPANDVPAEYLDTIFQNYGMDLRPRDVNGVSAQPYDDSIRYQQTFSPDRSWAEDVLFSPPVLASIGAAMLAPAGAAVGDAAGVGGAIPPVATSTPPASYWNVLADGGVIASDAAPAAAGSMGAPVDYLAGAQLPGYGTGAGLGLVPEATNTLGASLGAAPSAGAAATLAPALTNGLSPLAASVMGATAAGAAGGAAGGATNAVTGSALSRILSGAGTTADYAQVGGAVGLGALGYTGAKEQADAIRDSTSQTLGFLGQQADRQYELGAPYRERLNASYQPGFTMANDPGYTDALNQAQNTFMRAASAGRAPGVSGGNPYDNPGAWGEALKYTTSNVALPQLNTYRSQLGTFGSLGTNTAGALGSQAGQSMQQGGILGAQANSGAYNAIGYGLQQATQPDDPWKGILSNYMQPFKMNSGRTF